MTAIVIDVMKRIAPHSDIRNPIVWLVWCIVIIITILVLVTAFSSRSSDPISSWWMIGMTLVVQGAAFVIALAVQSSYRSVRTRISNAILHSVARKVMEGRPIPYDLVVYLRPHWLDGFCLVKNPDWRELSHLPMAQLGLPITADLLEPSFWLSVQYISVDELLAKSFGESCIMSLGVKTMKMATGSIVVSDEVWKEVVTRFLNIASCIVFTPDTSLGLKWEFLEVRKSQFADRVIFLEPPDTGKDAIKQMIRVGVRGIEDSQMLWKDHWTNVRSYFSREFDCGLPEFQPKGCAVALSPTPSRDTQIMVDRINAVLDRSAGSLEATKKCHQPA